MLLGTLKEGNIQDVAIGRLNCPQESRKVCVPSDAEGVVPATKNRITGLELQIGLALVAPEATGRDIPNNVRVVRSEGADAERDVKRLDRGRLRGTVLLVRPLNTVELGREVRGLVNDSVALLKGDVATPMADFDIPLQP